MPTALRTTACCCMVPNTGEPTAACTKPGPELEGPPHCRRLLQPKICYHQTSTCLLQPNIYELLHTPTDTTPDSLLQAVQASCSWTGCRRQHAAPHPSQDHKPAKTLAVAAAAIHHRWQRGLRTYQGQVPRKGAYAPTRARYPAKGLTHLPGPGTPQRGLRTYQGQVPHKGSGRHSRSPPS